MDLLWGEGVLRGLLFSGHHLLTTLEQKKQGRSMEMAKVIKIKYLTLSKKECSLLLC